MLILFIDGSRKIRDVTIIESFQLNRYNVERCKSTSYSILSTVLVYLFTLDAEKVSGRWLIYC